MMLKRKNGAVPEAESAFTHQNKVRDLLRPDFEGRLTRYKLVFQSIRFVLLIRFLPEGIEVSNRNFCV